MQFPNRLPIACLVLLSSACGLGDSSTPTAPTKPPTPTFGPPSVVRGSYTISGVVRDGLRPLGGVAINAWIQQDRMGYSYWWANGAVHTGADGHYQFSGLPSTARVHVQAWTDDYVQQCAVPEITVSDSVSLDVQLVSKTNLSSLESSSPSSASGYRVVTGRVYETTDGGRHPLAGAYIDYEPVMDFPAAYTYSDDTGDFLLCGIPTAQSATLGASHARNVTYVTILPDQTHIDIELP